MLEIATAADVGLRLTRKVFAEGIAIVAAGELFQLGIGAGSLDILAVERCRMGDGRKVSI